MTVDKGKPAVLITVPAGESARPPPGWLRSATTPFA